MMKDHFTYFLRYSILFIMALTFQAGANNTGTNLPVRLEGHVPSLALEHAVLLGSLEDNATIPLTFTLPLRDSTKLENLLQRIYDPQDSEYFGKYLTSEEFNEQFAPTQEDYNQVVAYAESLGLTVVGTHQNRTLLNVRGPKNSVETAFNLNLHRYQLPNGRVFHAPNNDPSVPPSIASIINGIVGLDNQARWIPHYREKQVAEEPGSSAATPQSVPSGPGGGYAPNDLVNAYDLSGVSNKGAGQIIALFELGVYQTSDINAYTSYFGLPAANLTNVLVDGGAGTTIDPEVTLDIELAIALAPQSQIYVYEGPNTGQGVLDTYNRIATDNIAKQVSTSWGLGETLVNSQYLQAENAIFMQMAAHGQTIYGAAGDSGAYDNYPYNSSQALVVNDPAAQPYVVCVGGTKLSVNSATGSYASEAVWNNGLGNAGGGGVSATWPIPTWQSNVPTVYSKTNRNVPDVSLNADPNTGYAIFYSGKWTIYGGTSCAAPLWAAFTACVNQELVASQKPVLGFANPAFYAIGLGTSYGADFHDVTSGTNLYYSAAPGYDNATGWGSFNGINLFASLTNTPSQLTTPLLNIAMIHGSPFVKGGVGTYVINISNSGTGPTTGPVTVSINPPQGLTYKSLTGSGWTFNPATLTCTQNAVLNTGSGYSQIVLKVNVAANAPSSFTPSATVSGGGSVSSTVTNRTTAH